MTGVAPGDGDEMVDDGDDDPLERLEQLLEEARRLEPVDDELPSQDDPLEELEARIERAKRMAEGEGGEALRRLEDRIERAHWIPRPEPYQPPEGDPLEALEARARGEEPAETSGPRPAEGAGASSPEAGPSGPAGAGPESESTGGGDRHRRLGSALEESLKKRDLPGEVRAEVAARLAELMDEEAPEQLEAIWELVVFGED